MVHALTPPPTPTSIPTGWAWLDSILVVLYVIFASVGVLFIAVLGGPRYPVDFLPRAATALVVVTVAIALIAEFTLVRRVEIDSRGVTFRYLLHTEFGSWDSLSPFKSPIEHGMWGFARSRRGQRSASERGHLVTLQQAKAILIYPTAPKWTIRQDVAARIGIGMSVS
jgi:hypothetical protein